ncbi:MAG: hypothetical protein ATN35_12885 [Epulopiscium sp. Nele67-Bin004]|nr:MAG: hypothetical protein ATN35_12885 [Epulopiscium sp. Nele67-Bin004]
MTLEQKISRYKSNDYETSPYFRNSEEEDFVVNFVHNSTKIEGNSYSLMETKIHIVDGITVGGKKVSEAKEISNKKDAYDLVVDNATKHIKLTEELIKDIHHTLTTTILLPQYSGTYRNHEVRISGSKHTPPSGQTMYTDLKFYYQDMVGYYEKLDAISLASWSHCELVRIHPFSDGNGRLARLVLNYQLMYSGLPAINIFADEVSQYYLALQHYDDARDYSKMSEIIEKNLHKRLDSLLGNK